jgi:serine/threonine protein kinase
MSRESRCVSIMKHKLLVENWRGYDIHELIHESSTGILLSGTRIHDQKPVALKYIPDHVTLAYKDLSPGVTVPAELYWLHMAQSIDGCAALLGYFKISDGWVVVTERLGAHMDMECYSRHLHVDGMTENEARYVFRQCVITLDALRSVGIVHNAVTPGSFLVDRETREVTLWDFRAATAVQFERFTKFHGSEGFRAPEIIAEKRFDGLQFTVWCLGIVLFHLLNGRMPFQTETEILAGGWKCKHGVSEEAQDLISEMLNPNPSARPELDMILCHPWMQPTAEEEACDAIQGYYCGFKTVDPPTSTVFPRLK